MFHAYTIVDVISLLFGSREQFYLNVDKDTAVDTEPEEIPLNPTIDITWAQTGIDIEVKNGIGYTFTFGIIESTEDCANNEDYGCWTAEGCLNAYSTPEGAEEHQHPSYCHPVGDVGGNLQYSESLENVIQNIDFVTPGSKTAFPAPTDENTYEFGVTYYLRAVSTSSNPTDKCWSWGVNPEYYTEAGCISPIPVRLQPTETSPRRQRFELPIQNTWTP